MARRWRVFTPGMDPARGVTLRLSADESHHIRRVLRLQPGERVAVFDGEDQEWEAVLLAGEGAQVSVRLESPIEDPIEAPCRVTLFQSVCPNERLDWAIQKAAEVGIYGIHLVRTERADRRKIDSRRLARWQRIAVEACKQSGRRRVPAIAVDDGLPAPAPGIPAILLHPGGEARPLADVLAGPAAGEVWLAVGPQSGFSEVEVEAAVSAGWRPAALGPRQLRAETAGLVAGAIVLHSWADLGAG